MPDRWRRSTKLLDVPTCRQDTAYSCGAAALESVLKFYGFDVSEGDLVDALGTNSKVGTPLKNVISYCESLGLRCASREKASLDDVFRCVDRGFPAIMLIQAWGEEGTDYADTWDDGHYVVAVGYDDDNLYLMDPSEADEYTYIPLDEVEDRWHDIDVTTDPDDAEALDRFLLVIRPPEGEGPSGKGKGEAPREETGEKPATKKTGRAASPVDAWRLRPSGRKISARTVLNHL